MIRLYTQLYYFQQVLLLRQAVELSLHIFRHLAIQYPMPVFWTKNYVILAIIN
jgi:hypothetical protein